MYRCLQRTLVVPLHHRFLDSKNPNKSLPLLHVEAHDPLVGANVITRHAAGFSSGIYRDQFGEAGLLVVDQRHLAAVDEEGDVEDVLDGVGEARRVADELVKVDRLLVVIPRGPN